MRDTGYEILYDLKQGEYRAPDPGGIRTRTTRSGQLLEVECYPVIRLSQEAERERQRRRSSPAQEKLNLRNSRRRVERLLEANFTPGDMCLHLTVNDDTVDPGMVNLREYAEDQWTRSPARNDDELRRLIRNYIARVKRRAEDPKRIKWLYVIEAGKEKLDGDGEPLPPRYHVHMVIHAPGLSREQLEELWSFGYANCDRLSFRGNGLEALSKYITKQNGLDGGDARRRRWAHSRNLKEPTVTVSDRKVSRRRAAKVAADVMKDGVELLEKLYPGYRCTEPPTVRYSDFVAGAYIYAKLRRRR